MDALKCRHVAALGCLLAVAATGSSFVLDPQRTISPSPLGSSNFTQTTTAPETAVTPTTPTSGTRVYWIRRAPDYQLLYITVPLAAGILLVVLIFFLWVFSTKPESPQDNYDYDRLEEEVVPGPSTSSGSPTHPVVDQILDLPYTNPIEVNDDLPTV